MLIKLKENNLITRVTVKSSRRHNLVRDSRRRLGLTQKHLATLVNYQDRSQIAHLERGSRNPGLLEALKLEIVLGRPASEIFTQLRRTAWREVVKQLNEKLLLSGCLQPRVSYKPGQLAEVLASLRSRSRAKTDKHQWSATASEDNES